AGSQPHPVPLLVMEGLMRRNVFMRNVRNDGLNTKNQPASDRLLESCWGDKKTIAPVESNPKEILPRKIGATEGLAIAVTMVVGSGLFALPGLAIEKTDHLTAFYAWVTVTFIVSPFILIFSQLGTRFPESSGIPGFAAEALGAWTRPGFTLVACGALAIGM